MRKSQAGQSFPHEVWTTSKLEVPTLTLDLMKLCKVGQYRVCTVVLPCRVIQDLLV